MKNPHRMFSTIFFTFTLLSGLLVLLLSCFHSGYRVSGYLIITLLFDILFIFWALASHLFKSGRKTFESISLVLFSLMVTFLAAEFFLRSTNKYLTAMEVKYAGKYISPFRSQFSGWYDLWRPKSKHFLRTKEYCYVRQTNSLGLSDTEPLKIKKEGEYRILGIGDSYTEGDGTHADSTWLKFLERNLKFTYKIKNVTFINAGICGSDPYEEFKLLNDKLLPLAPDLVIVTINSGDVDDILCRGGMERFRSDSTLQFRSPPVWEGVYSNSYIFRLLIHKLFRYNFIFMNRNEYEIEQKKAISLLVRSIILFNGLGEKYKFQLLFVFHPFKHELDDGNFAQLNSIIDSCKLYGIEYLNLLGYYRDMESYNKSNSQQLYWKTDGHHNATGYDAFARGVEWKLKLMEVIGRQQAQNFDQ